jgi:hypothetical protein
MIGWLSAMLRGRPGRAFPHETGAWFAIGFMLERIVGRRTTEPVEVGAHDEPNAEQSWGKEPHEPSLMGRTLSMDYLATFLELAIGLFMLPFNAAHLGPAAYGLWILAVSPTVYFSMLDLGYAASLVKFVTQYRARRDSRALNELASTMFMVFALIGIVAYGVAMVIAFNLTRVFDIGPTPATTGRQILLIVGVYIALGFPCSVYGGIVNGFQRRYLNGAVAILTSIIVAAVNIVLLLRGHGLAARARYRDSLVEYFSAVKNQLDQDSIRRLEQNPLRILDSKNPDMRALVEAAPVMLDYLDTASAEHFAELRNLLDAAGVSYTLNPRLVRGLDYYNRTVFEWVTDALGAQGAVCSGGRYDGLVEKLGGRSTPAIGWAMGIERLVELFHASGGRAPAHLCDVYVVAVGEGTQAEAFAIAEELRDARPGTVVEVNLGGGSFKAQMKRADKSNAAFALVLGEAELAGNEVGLKPLRSNTDQSNIARNKLTATLISKLDHSASGR